MNIVGFAGPAQAGKTTAAGFLTEALVKEGQTIYPMSFAAPLRNCLACLGVSKEPLPTLYRKLAQDIGSNLRNPEYLPNITGPDYFINLMSHSIAERIAAEQQEYDAGDEDDGAEWSTIIIDDVRYPNEIKMIRAMGGVVAFIDPGQRIKLDEEFRKHESEQLATECLRDARWMNCWTDLQIMNDGTVDEFQKEINIFKYELIKENYGA